MGIRFFTFTIVSLIILAIWGCKTNPLKPLERGPIWVAFTRTNTPSLPDDNIHTIYVSQSRRAWFGSDSGAFSFFAGAWSSPPRDSFNYWIFGSGGNYIGRKVTSIAEAIDGSIWFGLHGGGVRRMNKSGASVNWQRYYGGNNFVTGISAVNTGSGFVWIATTRGVAEYLFPLPPEDPTKGTFLDNPPSNLPSSTVYSTTLDPVNQTVYFGTDQGVASYNELKNLWKTFNIKGISFSIQALAVDFKNTIWCGKLIGVTSYDPVNNILRDYTPNNSRGTLPNDIVNTVTTDFFGTTRWFGTMRGLVQLQDTTWTLFNQSNTPILPSDVIQALYYDYKENLWIGTNKGIVIYNPNGTILN